MRGSASLRASAIAWSGSDPSLPWAAQDCCGAKVTHRVDFFPHNTLRIAPFSIGENLIAFCRSYRRRHLAVKERSMFNQPTVSRAFVKSACTMAIALLTIGMGVNSSWARSDQSSGLKFAPISRVQLCDGCGQLCGHADQPYCPSGCYCKLDQPEPKKCQPLPNQ
jgi:hypothetical protein